MKIPAYCLDWHIKNSDAFRDILCEPLKGYCDIDLIAWDGAKLPNRADKSQTVIFCMLPPTDEDMKKIKKVIWIPMWDQAQSYNDEWWSRLPKTIRIVAFSKKVYLKAQKAGLDVIRLKYYPAPNQYAASSWTDGNIIFYWNRVGLVGPRFLEKLCKSTNASRLLFKSELDPRIDSSKFYDLPPRLGKTKVINVLTTKNRQDFLDQIKSANVIISPRLTEGVGMVFLESMARGCVTIANNAPTMNEYIADRQTGILINPDYEIAPTKTILERLHLSSNKDLDETNYFISSNQQWNDIAALDFEEIGNSAKKSAATGYGKWQASQAEYAKFILK